MNQNRPIIGTLNEKPLHAALKTWISQPGDRFETPVNGYVIDILRGDLLIEIQTGGFSALKTKLSKLTQDHRVRLVYPIAQEKWLVKLPVKKGGKADHRKSPKRGRVEEVFRELVRIPSLLARPNFSLEVLLIQEEEVRRFDGRRAWRRRGWVTEERRLLAVLSSQRFETPADIWTLVPRTLPTTFTSADLASAMAMPRWLAQKAVYCLRKMELIESVGKSGRSILYRHVRD